MNLEEINNSYGEVKQKIANAEKKYEELNAKIQKFKKPYYGWKFKLISAQEKEDEAGIKEAQGKLNDIKKKVGEIKAQANKQKEDIEKFKSQINEKIESIKKDPELQNQIDSALLRRYERQENKLTKEKAELVGKKVGLLSFKDMINEHPSVGNNFYGVFSSIQWLNDVEEKIEENKIEENGTIKWKDYSIFGELELQRQEANEKLQKNYDLLKDYCAKNNISEQDVKSYINMIGENIPRYGKIDLEDTFNKTIKKMDKQILSYDKRITDYNTLKNELRNSLGLSDNTLENKTTDETLKDNESENVPENTSSESKIKWWQFGTRFKNWWARRKLSRIEGLPAPSNATENVKEENENKGLAENKEDTRKSSENFRYEIVREAMESQQKDDFRFAKEVRKQNMENKDIDEEER